MNMVQHPSLMVSNVPLSANEQADWRTKPHRFLNEALKLSAKSCSAIQAAIIFRRGRCWWCGVVEGEHQ